jgi:hypothetical protein
MVRDAEFAALLTVREEEPRLTARAGSATPN